MKSVETTKGEDTELWNENNSSLFLRAVEEREIIDTVRKCKSKSSTDWNHIDMIIVRNIIEDITEP